MTKPFIDPRRLHFQARAGNGRVKQHGDGNLWVPKPPRNAPCPCGSGKKAKRCHPEGLQPIVKRVILNGDCAACGAKGVEVIPLKHEGLKDWQRSVCVACVRTPVETFQRLQAAATVHGAAVVQEGPAAGVAGNVGDAAGTATLVADKAAGETRVREQEVRDGK